MGTDGFPARPPTSITSGWWPRKARVTLSGGLPVVEADIQVSTGEYIRPNTVYHGAAPPVAELEPSIRAGRSRLVLIVCNGCPWAHRSMVTRELLGLHSALELVETDDWSPLPFRVAMPFAVPAISTCGWRIKADRIPPQMKESLPEVLKARVRMSGYLWLWELYVHSDPQATGRVSVPTLWDCETQKIVHNESSSLLRLMNDELRPLCKPGALDLTPAEYDLAAIDRTNEIIYDLNNGVYRVGFVGTAAARQQAIKEVYTALDFLENKLASGGPFVMGEKLTECDVRLYTSLIRFDFGYYLAFKVNEKARLRHAYPNVFKYLQRLYAIPEFSDRSFPSLFGAFYIVISRWEGHTFSNLARVAELSTFILLRATTPDCPAWRFRLAELLSSPFALMGYLTTTP